MPAARRGFFAFLITTAMVAVFGLAGLALTSSAQAAACTPGDRSGSITGLTLSDAQGVLSADNTVTAWQLVKLEFSGALPQGGCAGDTVTITVPPQLNTFTGTFPVKTPGGIEIGTMVVTNGVITVTFNDYIETHVDVTYNGWVQLQVNDKMVPGTPYELSFSVGTVAQTIPVTTGPCPNCGKPITYASKWAALSSDKTRVSFGLESAVTQQADELITITDNVGSGQAIDCNSIVVRSASSFTAWGYRNYTATVTPESKTCTGTSVTITVKAAAAGMYYGMFGSANVTAVQDTYSDSGTVTQAGKTADVRAVTQSSSGGAGGNGTVTPTPTPSANPTETVTTTATATSTVTATATETATATATSTVTATETATATSTVTATSTATTTETSTATTTATSTATATTTATMTATGTATTTVTLLPTSTPTSTATTTVTATASPAAGSGAGAAGTPSASAAASTSPSVGSGAASTQPSVTPSSAGGMGAGTKGNPPQVKGQAPKGSVLPSTGS